MPAGYRQNGIIHPPNGHISKLLSISCQFFFSSSSVRAFVHTRKPCVRLWLLRSEYMCRWNKYHYWIMFLRFHSCTRKWLSNFPSHRQAIRARVLNLNWISCVYFSAFCLGIFSKVWPSVWAYMLIIWPVVRPARRAHGRLVWLTVGHKWSPWTIVKHHNLERMRIYLWPTIDILVLNIWGRTFGTNVCDGDEAVRQQVAGLPEREAQSNEKYCKRYTLHSHRTTVIKPLNGQHCCTASIIHRMAECLVLTRFRLEHGHIINIQDIILVAYTQSNWATVRVCKKIEWFPHSCRCRAVQVEFDGAYSLSLAWCCCGRRHKHVQCTSTRL